MPKAVATETVNHVIALLQNGKSLREIEALTGLHYSTISKLRSTHCPTISKAKGGRPSLLSTANLHYATRLIGTGKATTSPAVARALGDVTGRVVNAETVRRGLKKAGMKAVVKRRRPLLAARH
ncbi:uncharacterized protein LAESUDRAFT_795606 [Laetiporus sulphureus 93-53]|uniref:Transposase Tc1-like domain-containing protein n=1 Tax=Laetiporus sulphureus 93-53 TaxID=1314785 RepID=A0A165BUA1_9APHY|nr:uncharacterized protein LAESUDRAFT_795606 [Laetiporus sulphureus 93-53]KZT01662.1 hypothetical protein LAESUDRAFT_795606 [Laetiporus sulphureus 93-53]